MRTFVHVSSKVGVCCALVLMLSLTAMAELGGTVSTVQADQERVRGTRVLTQRAAYTVHEISTPNSGMIREYVSPEGKVFAVTYEGRFPGESSGLLGSFSGALEQARKADPGPKHIGGNVHYAVPGMVYHAAGHMGYFHMVAYASDGLPKGVTAGEIQ